MTTEEWQELVDEKLNELEHAKDEVEILEDELEDIYQMDVED